MFVAAAAQIEAISRPYGSGAADEGGPGAAPVRLIPAGEAHARFPPLRYHGFITDRDGETLFENAIRLKYGVGLNHLPSGRFTWLAVQVMAHNLSAGSVWDG